jgi:hypothetical protein
MARVFSGGVISLKNIGARKKNLKRFDKTLNRIAEQIKTGLIQRWTKGIGGDDVRLAKLTEPYKAKKRSSGRKGIADFNLSGDLYRSLFWHKSGFLTRTISFRGEEIKKARGLSKQRGGIRKNFMKVSDKWRRKLLKFVFREVKKR